MNRKFAFILMLLAAATAGPAGAAPVTNSAPATSAAAAPAPVKADAKMDFDSFHLITQRNIFDMSRTGRIGVKYQAPPVKVDDFSLVGTMSYEKGQYAFFDGNSSEFRQNLKPAETIGGFKITTIGPDYVELQSTNNKTVKMLVGWGMRREDNGPWSEPTMSSDTSFADSGSSNRDTVDRSDRSGRNDRGSGRSDRRLYRNSRGDRSSASGMGDPGPGADQNSNGSSGGSESDVIKRLMEKRAKEVKDGQ
jgi:hypothetical protein